MYLLCHFLPVISPLFNQASLLISPSFCSILASSWVFLLKSGWTQHLLRKLSPFKHPALNFRFTVFWNLGSTSPLPPTTLWMVHGYGHCSLLRGHEMWKGGGEGWGRDLGLVVGNVTNGSGFVHEKGMEAAQSCKRWQ